MFTMFYRICFPRYFNLENFTINQIFFRQCVHAMNSPNFPAAKVSLHMVHCWMVQNVLISNNVCDTNTTIVSLVLNTMWSAFDPLTHYRLQISCNIFIQYVTNNYGKYLVHAKYKIACKFFICIYNLTTYAVPTCYNRHSNILFYY